MIHDKHIRVGACDWDHAHWRGSFYPDDLPEDWRLGYYANEFSAVWLPKCRWQADEADFEQWAEDVPDDFVFYLQGQPPGTDPVIRKALQTRQMQINEALGAKLAGFLSENVSLLEYQSKSLRQWRQWLDDNSPQAIFLTDKTLTIKQLTDFKALLELMGR